ncbi:MAG: response regulator [Chloroflexota bacterium]
MPSVLITDDDDTFRATIALALEDAGYDTYEACNGKEALHLLATIRIDLILLDIIMPEMEGIETIKQIAGKYTEIPVITISGNTAQMDTNVYLKMTTHYGAKATLKKPFSVQTLLQLVQLHVKEQTII